MRAETSDRIRNEIAAIQADHRSGSAALTRKAGDVLGLLVQEQFGSPAAFAETLAAVCRLLIAAQPCMAPLLNLSNAALLAGSKDGEPETMQSEVGAVVASFLQRMDSAANAIADRASHLVKGGMTVMTHSSSETVKLALLRAHAQGREMTVIATESRPICEGAALAEELGRAGLAVALIVDAAMMRFLPDASLVLVGADAITTGGLVNKAGTSLLALGARELGIELFALAGSEKFLPAAYLLPRESPKDSAEVLRQAQPNVTVRNLYFDLTPLELVTGVVTEEGVLEPASLRSRLSQMALHPALT